jgi:hypothetical protein
MAYTINLTDGTIFAVVADGTFNDNSSMVLVGKNYAGYGEFLNENFVHLLENGANTTAPGNPLIGQLWWDKGTNTMKVYTGTTFKTISSATSSPTAPANNVVGDLWWDTTNHQMKVWNGATFTLIGPASAAGQGTSGAIVDTVIDSVNAPHVVIKLFVGDTLVGVVSRDPTFTPQVGIGGFSNIAPGIQLSTSVPNALFNGMAADAERLDGINSTQFLRSDINDSTSGTLAILNDTGLSVGADQDARIVVTGTDVFVRNQTQSGNLTLTVNVAGSTTTALAVSGATADTGVRGITNLNATGVGNIGSSTNSFNTIFARATSAQYADVAENYSTDSDYPPATVVVFGGEKEITASTRDHDAAIAGVISTKPAYLMNSGTRGLPVALQGRVPCQVVGQIHKGDRLVASDIKGVAKVLEKDKYEPGCIIGKALEDYNSEQVGTIEVVVGRV